MGKKPEIRNVRELAPGYARYRELLTLGDPSLPERLARGAVTRVESFIELASAFDLVMLDAYGVLNLGGHAIVGAPEAMQGLARAGIPFLVVSNNASQSPERIVERLTRMGFPVTLDHLVTSGMAVAATRPGSVWEEAHYLLIGTEESRASYAPDPDLLEWRWGDPGRPGYLLLCSDRDYWGSDQEARVEGLLGQGVLPIVLANPDLAAPEEGGAIYPVVGLTAHHLWRRFGCPLTPLGKPFAPIFRLAMERAGKRVEPGRVLMVGDTLDTDILGGAAMGFATCLVLSGVHAAEAGAVERLCRERGVFPDYVLASIAVDPGGG